MIQATGQVVPLKLDVDRKDVAPFAEKYKVSAIPALFLLDSTGKVVDTLEFTNSPKEFAARLKASVKKHAPK